MKWIPRKVTTSSESQPTEVSTRVDRDSKTSSVHIELNQFKLGHQARAANLPNATESSS